VADRDAPAEALAPDLPGVHTERLWRPRGAGRYGWAGVGTRIKAGDALVVYRLREGVAGDVIATNALFSAHFYGEPGTPLDPWPDEAELILAEIPARGARVLEICCGAGRLTAALARSGNAVLGVDLVPACVRRARRGAPAGVAHLVGDARALPLADGGFDLALCLDNSLGVLAGSEALVLAELARVLRPGGRVLLGLRTLPGPAPRLERYLSDDGYLELARVLPEAWTTLFLRRIERRGALRLLPRPRPRGARPWGGEVGYWALERRS